MGLEGEPQKEKKPFRRLELKVVEPHFDKNFMIAFDDKEENLCAAYSAAIRKICTEHKLNPFHQVGSYEKTGYQAWEMWRKTSREELEGLLDEVQKEAKEMFERWYSYSSDIL